MKDLKTKVQEYLETLFGPEASLETLEPLGKGVHGAAFLVRFNTRQEEHSLILKTLFPAQFGHDHFSDRARVLLLAHDDYNVMPHHVRALDVVGAEPEKLISLKQAREFYILMEPAKGTGYFGDLDAILERRALTATDEERARVLARFLAGIHQERYSGGNARSLYRRRIRELVGHGECIMGIVDTYGPVVFADTNDLLDYAEKGVLWWGRIRDRQERLCAVHGDFHPGNIRFDEEDFTLLDRSRGRWGEPADDVACLAANYIYYALKDGGCFEGPFAALCRLFMNTYLEITGDLGMVDLIQPFFAFRMLVIAHPDFYPHDTLAVKRRLLDFGRTVLRAERFSLERVPAYLQGQW